MPLPPHNGRLVMSCRSTIQDLGLTCLFTRRNGHARGELESPTTSIRGPLMSSNLAILPSFRAFPQIYPVVVLGAFNFDHGVPPIVEFRDYAILPLTLVV